jgi:hypothetical protein
VDPVQGDTADQHDEPVGAGQSMPCPEKPERPPKRGCTTFSIQFADQAEYARRRAIVARAFQETIAMRKLILAALVAAAFSIPAFAAQTAPAKPAQAAAQAAAPAPAAAPTKAAAPVKAEHKATKAEHHHANRHHASKHHQAKKADSAGAK